MSRTFRIGLIGFGNHALKNVVAKLDSESSLTISKIFVRDVEKYKDKFDAYAGLFTSDIQEVLEQSDIVYILSPISTHYAYADRALDRGLHVWCEKPMTGNLVETRKLVSKARDKNLFLGEIVAYQYHRQFCEIEQLIAEQKNSGQRMLLSSARFCIPELEADNIRYRSEMGGGALLDVGFYPLSIAADLFGLPISVAVSSYFSDQLGVDLNGSALLDYGDFAHLAHWAIGSSYTNQMEISFSKSHYHIERVFSKPADLITRMTFNDEFSNDRKTIMVDADDQFGNMFLKFIEVITARDTQKMHTMNQQSLVRAELLDRVRQHVGNA